MTVKWNKRAVALLLTVLMTVPSVAAVGSFPDIPDVNTARDVEVLQMLGVLNGVSPTQFDPAGTLTRAQFTKMAVMMLGKGDRVSAYQNYTIFPDVATGYWAAGYINLAVRGEEKFISGYATGTFEPERTITYGQAVTILMRLLGYKDADVGMRWPEGYLDAAYGIKLTEGLSLQGGDVIRRDQAARLFANLLNTELKEGGKTFAGKIAGSVKPDAILLNAKATAQDGSPAIETTEGTFKLAGTHTPQSMVGQKGTILLDSSERAMTFVPNPVGSAQSITVSTAKAGEIKDLTGKTYKLTAETVTYYKDKKTTYGEMFVNLRSGTQVTFYFGASGKVEYLFVGETTATDAVVVNQNGSSSGFTALSGGRNDYAIYKNGETVTAKELRLYDVATYQAGQNRIVISDDRIKGCYESAYPNTEAPSKLTLLGHEFKVLPSAMADLSQFKIGDAITLLLTEDQQVAGAVDAKLLPVETVGIMTEGGGGKAKITLPNGLILSGKTEGDSDKYQGALVNVSAYKTEYLSVYPVRIGSAAGTLDIVSKSLKDVPLAANVKLFERVGTGAAATINLTDVRTRLVDSGKIQYVHYNYKGQADVLLLNNVTGDRYTYGRTNLGSESVGDQSVSTVSVTNGTGTVGPVRNGDLRGSVWAGIALQQDKKSAETVRLETTLHVTNANWQDDEKVLLQGVSYPVSEAVVCYNKSSGQWVTLAEARAFATEMTLYCDPLSVVRVVEVQ